MAASSGNSTYARSMTNSGRLSVSAILLLAIGVGVPLLERWIKCQAPSSEACVWAKAYLPLSFALWSVAGLVAAVIAWMLLRGRSK
jgi:hypothetical protein